MAADGGLADADPKEMGVPLADLLCGTQTACFARVFGEPRLAGSDQVNSQGSKQRRSRWHLIFELYGAL